MVGVLLAAAAHTTTEQTNLTLEPLKAVMVL
jgi:hypothetical protein